MYGSLKRTTLGLLSFQNMKGLKGVIVKNIYLERCGCLEKTDCEKF